MADNCKPVCNHYKFAIIWHLRPLVIDQNPIVLGSYKQNKKDSPCPKELSIYNWTTSQQIDTHRQRGIQLNSELALVSMIGNGLCTPAAEVLSNFMVASRQSRVLNSDLQQDNVFVMKGSAVESTKMLCLNLCIRYKVSLKTPLWKKH